MDWLPYRKRYGVFALAQRFRCNQRTETNTNPHDSRRARLLQCIASGALRIFDQTLKGNVREISRRIAVSSRMI